MALKSLAKTLPISLPQAEIVEFCQQWQIAELALFGSVLRDDFRPESDIDMLVTFAPEAQWSLFDWVEMADELEVLLRRKVDLVTKKSIEQSHNWIRRREILGTAQVIYEQG